MQTTTSESLPRTIPELLENHAIQVQPQGYSMYPLFVPGRDSAVIEKADCDRLKKGDVILYRRENGILVLHRICRITKDGFYTVGDNQTAVEGPLTASQISGKLIHIIRNGHSFSVNHPVYRILSGFWLFLRPVRRPICLLTAKLKSIVNIFFVPFGQDNYLSKPNSMIAHVDLIEDTIEKALGGRQIQPVIKSPHVTIL